MFFYQPQIWRKNFLGTFLKRRKSVDPLPLDQSTPAPLIFENNFVNFDNSTNIFFQKIKFKHVIWNDSSFLGLYNWVHKCTSGTPLTHAPFTGAIWNNSLFLGLYDLVDECTSLLVEHLPCVADPCMQSRTTRCFKGCFESVAETLPSSHK